MADMLLPPHLSKVPAGMVDAIEQWFGGHPARGVWPLRAAAQPTRVHSTSSMVSLNGRSNSARTIDSSGCSPNPATSVEPCGGDPVQHGGRASRRAASSVCAARAGLGVTRPRRASFRPRGHRRQPAATRQREGVQRDRAHGAGRAGRHRLHPAAGARKDAHRRRSLLGWLARVSIRQAWTARGCDRLDQRSALPAGIRQAVAQGRTRARSVTSARCGIPRNG